MSDKSGLFCPKCKRPDPKALGPIPVSGAIAQVYMCECGFLFSVPNSQAPGPNPPKP